MAYPTKKTLTKGKINDRNPTTFEREWRDETDAELADRQAAHDASIDNYHVSRINDYIELLRGTKSQLDWTQLVDAPLKNQDAFTTYRASLDALIANKGEYVDGSGDPVDKTDTFWDEGSVLHDFVPTAPTPEYKDDYDPENPEGHEPPSE